jgi:hypothetical protein
LTEGQQTAAISAQALGMGQTLQAGSNSSSELLQDTAQDTDVLLSTRISMAAEFQQRMQEAAREKTKFIVSDLVTACQTSTGLLKTLPCLGVAQNCPCRLVPVLAHHLEQQQDEVQEVAAVLASGLHKVLPAVAAALLEQGHSTRAFRRINEAYEM